MHFDWPISEVTSRGVAPLVGGPKMVIGLALRLPFPGTLRRFDSEEQHRIARAPLARDPSQRSGEPQSPEAAVEGDTTIDRGDDTIREIEVRCSAVEP